MGQTSLAGRETVAGSRPTGPRTGSGRRWIWAGFVVLFVAHHDFWWWDDRMLVWGGVPIGLAYHAGFSVAAGLLWALASRYAWPTHIEEWADQPGRGGASAEAGADSGEERS